MIHKSKIVEHILQKAKKGKKQLPKITKKEAEKIILDFEDLLMKIVAYKGLEAYDVPEMLKNFRELKNNLKWSIESMLRAKKHKDDMSTVQEMPTTSDTTLDVKSDKTYKF